MKIGFVGAGKVGTALGRYFKDAGLTVTGYYSLTLEAANKAASYVGCKGYDRLDKFLDDTDVIFLTTNDANIVNACKSLVATGHINGNHWVGHTSGAHDVSELLEAKEKGARVFSMHPLQAFADIDKSVRDLANTYFGVEGDLGAVEKIVALTGNKTLLIPEGKKGIYHMSAVVLSNYLVTVMDYGISMLSSMGIDQDDAYQAMKPLIEGSMKNINELGTKAALTGPIVRGDINTIKIHLDALASLEECDEDVYKALGNHAVKIAKRRGLEASLVDGLSETLK